MSTLSLRVPENGSSRSGIATNFSANTDSGEEISAFLPKPNHRPKALYSSSDLSRPSNEIQNTMPDAPAVLQPQPLIRLNSASGPMPRKIRILQQWEGVIIEVGNSDFTAELRNLTEIDSPPQVAEFPYSEISNSDRSLVAPGAVFYWSIGYDTTPGGQVRRVSEIRLRRSPEWTERKLEAVAAEAKEWYRILIEDGNEGSTQT